MTANEVAQLFRRQAGPLDSGEPSGSDRALVGAREASLGWFGGFLGIAFVIGALALIANPSGWLRPGSSQRAFAAVEPSEFRQQADRSDCAAIGESDLHSASEGVWYQGNCFASPESPVIAVSTSCNRTSLDPAEFTEVSPGLYVFRQTRTAAAYLWSASSENCFDLVSTRAVTAVCADQTVTFNWNASVCSAHGGVLAWVNGR